MRSNTSQKTIATTEDNTSAGDMTPFTPLTAEKKWSKFRKVEVDPPQSKFIE